MRTYRSRTAQRCLVFTVLYSGAAFAQARVSSEPPEPSLLNLTRQWSRASTLGDLRESRAGSNYLELRVWGGFGLTMTTQAVVLRRMGGQWSAFLARVVRCELQIPRSVGDTASRQTIRGYVVEARRQCGVSLEDVGAGVQIITADTLIVDRLVVADSTIESAWSAAQRAGVSDLPARVEHHQVVDDGFTYVIELRRGNDYRASMIEHVEQSQNDADRKVQAIYAAVSGLLPPEQRVKP